MKIVKLIIVLVIFSFAGTVSAAKLTADLTDNREGAVEVDKGEENVIFSQIEFTADDVEDIEITTIKVTRTGGTNADINGVRLYDSSENQIGSTQYLNNTIITFGDLSWIVPKGQSKTLYIKADISVNAGGGHVVYLNVLGSEGTGHVVARGIESEEAAETDCYIISRPITITDAIADKEAPGSPTNINVFNASDSNRLKLNISWVDSSASDLDHVKIYRSTQYGELGSMIKTVNPSEDPTYLNWHVDANLAKDTKYYYIIRSVDELGNESGNMDQYGATPVLSAAPEEMTAILRTSLSTTPASTKVIQNSSNVPFLKFKLVPNAATHWVLKTLELTRDGGDNDDLEKITIYLADDEIASTTALASSKITLDMNDLILQRGEEYIFTVKADISREADAGHGIYLKTSLIDANPSNAFPYSGFSKIGSASGETMIITALPSTTSDDIQTQVSSVKLIRAGNQPQVYKIISNRKLWIPTAEAFNKMGNNWSDIENVAGTAQYRRLKLAKLANDDKIYYLTEGGLKRYIPSTEVFNSYGNKWEDVVEISSNDLEAYPDSFLIRLEGGAKVYKLENGRKRWIKTAEAFNRLRYNWGDIAPVNAVELAAYEEGEIIEG